MEDPKNGRGDPKNGEGVEMNLEIFLEGGFIIMLDKISRDTQNWGWSKLFRKKTPPLWVFLAPSLLHLSRVSKLRYVCTKLKVIFSNIYCCLSINYYFPQTRYGFKIQHLGVVDITA